MDCRISGWFETGLANGASLSESDGESSEGRASIQRCKREVDSDVIGDDDLQQGAGGQLTSVLSNYFHLNTPAGTSWFQLGLLFVNIIYFCKLR